MNIQFQDLLPKDFANNSRVWVYQSNRSFTIDETLELEKILANFSKEWHSHGSSVKSYAGLFFGQFIVLMADETKVKVGGCSTDTSLRFIKTIEEEFNIHLLDRQLLSFIINEKIHLIPLADVNSAIEDGSIQPDTKYFNNTILTKKELLTQWIIPVKDSWLAKRMHPVRSK